MAKLSAPRQREIRNAAVLWAVNEKTRTGSWPTKAAITAQAKSLGGDAKAVDWPRLIALILEIIAMFKK